MTKEEKMIENWNKKTININEHKIVFITHNLFDIFLYNGWENVVRVKLNRANKTYLCLDEKQRTNPAIIRILNTIVPKI